MKVLIVDDSVLLRKYLFAMLSDIKGVEIVGEAGSVGEAIEAIRTLEPDVVILDIQMPGGNGIDVLEDIKKGKSAPRIIMFTNYPYPQYRKKCMDAGADFFFDKSAEFEKVVEVLRKMVNEIQSK